MLPEHRYNLLARMVMRLLPMEASRGPLTCLTDWMATENEKKGEDMIEHCAEGG